MKYAENSLDDKIIPSTKHMSLHKGVKELELFSTRRITSQPKEKLSYQP